MACSVSLSRNKNGAASPIGAFGDQQKGVVGLAWKRVEFGLDDLTLAKNRCDSPGSDAVDTGVEGGVTGG